ncbi:MAG: ABC transporter ATP-binding protein [Cyanobacteria bacterium]|nr:ABC transporter ATP-binding protein [Cyanobacteriota bacterium]MDW8200904.1 ABC transporter ATP-binding protein [Cyanobacteriota bacterium SKYGB_h_bin112]
MAQLELRHLHKSYSPKVIPVKDFSVTVEDGEFLTLLGPSGCGKSTLLRLIAGLEVPTRGQIIIGNRDVTPLGASDRNIAMVFQSYALYPHMTVYANMASGLRLRQVPEADIQQRVHDIAQILGLEALLDRKPSQLSGGQRQRVAVGRALVRRPDVFLLDEPLSNLDALLRERVRAELKQVFASQNAPVVYVTHDQVEAMTLSSRVAVLYDGDLQQLDSPQQIYSRPANQFVAGFVGSPQMNLIPLPCQQGYAYLGDTRIPLPPGFSAPEQITLGIRPEHVELAIANTDPSQTIALSGKISLVENLGIQTLVSVLMPTNSQEFTAIRALLPVDTYTIGDTIDLCIPLQAMHWFDGQTGDRLF